jgi:uncharacterized membrane protein
VSGDAEPSAPTGLPPAWAELEAAVERATLALASWRERALEAEREIVQLRTELESVAAQLEPSGNQRDELRRLRAENAALQSRMDQARRRADALLSWTYVLEDTR